MYLKFIFLAVGVVSITGCAERKIDILDRNGNIVGNCVAGYDWHLYGLQDSIDYMLYECAKGAINKGYRITDNSLLDKDFTLPVPPDSKAWNKKLAMQLFKRGELTETKLGYILAHIEYTYTKVVMAAEADFAAGKIDKKRFAQIVKTAKAEWLGQ